MRRELRDKLNALVEEGHLEASEVAELRQDEGRDFFFDTDRYQEGHKHGREWGRIEGYIWGHRQLAALLPNLDEPPATVGRNRES